MFFTATRSYLYCSEFSGALVSVDVDTIKPIQLALAADGGTIKLISAYLDSVKKEVFCINYFTQDSRVRISFELTKSEYLHNLDFFGEIETKYDSPIKFDLDNNKFKLP